MLCFVLLIRKSFIECLVVRLLKKYGTLLWLSMKGQIKLKSLKLVDTLDSMNCSKWNKMRVYSMYTRFTDIMNTLGALGKPSRIAKNLRKLLGHYQRNGDVRGLPLNKPKI